MKKNRQQNNELYLNVSWSWGWIEHIVNIRFQLTYNMPTIFHINSLVFYINCALVSCCGRRREFFPPHRSAKKERNLFIFATKLYETRFLNVHTISRYKFEIFSEIFATFENTTQVDSTTFPAFYVMRTNSHRQYRLKSPRIAMKFYFMFDFHMELFHFGTCKNCSS